MLKPLVFLAVAFGATNLATAQQQESVALQLTPQAVSADLDVRLLPTDPELKRGNAAVVMLRMIWEQQPYMQNVTPTFPELLKLRYDDPRIVDEFHFSHFHAQLKRAAYMRDADWHYPLGEEPQATILLPDVQGMREFVGRGMSLWVGQQIARKNLNAAREGILIQLACSRHIARTPLTINRLVAEALSGMAFEKVDLLVQQKDSANLYWALSLLPDSLGDTSAALQWDAHLIEGSLPALAAGDPGIGAAAWKQAAAEFSDLIKLQLPQPMSATAVATLRQRMLEVATEELPSRTHFVATDLVKMSVEEIGLRWVLATTSEVYAEIERAHSLAPPLALKKLLQLEAKTSALLTKIGAPTAPFPQKPAQLYVAFHRFDRRVKLLQTVESIRHYSATHNGELPPTLQELELPAPFDPLTGEPFEYTVSGKQAALRAKTLEGLDTTAQAVMAYSLTVKTTE